MNKSKTLILLGALYLTALAVIGIAMAYGGGPLAEEDFFMVLGIIFGLFCAVLLKFLTKKDVNRTFEYDERQRLVRGTAFKCGFFAMLVYFGLATVCVMCDIALPMETEVLLFGGLIVGIVPFACYCIWKDAYFSLNEKRKTLIAVFVVLGLVNIAIGVYHLLDGSVTKYGKLTERSLPLLCGAMIVILLANMVMKAFCDRKEGGE